MTIPNDGAAWEEVSFERCCPSVGVGDDAGTRGDDAGVDEVAEREDLAVVFAASAAVVAVDWWRLRLRDLAPGRLANDFFSCSTGCGLHGGTSGCSSD